MVELTVIVSRTLGWAYTIIWSISFYPQAILNHNRRSVTGVSIDFLALNPFGFSCYLIYNVVLATSPVVRREYAQRHQGHKPQVQLNDIVFAVNALVLSLLTLGQSFVFKRDPGQKSSTSARLFLVSATLAVIIGAIVAATSTALDFLDLLYALSYIKLFISLVKMIPQAILNFQRKSTIGWSIENIMMDMTGGLLSLLQLVVDAGHDNDWKAITGNPGKLGLSLLALGFDGVFLLQHFVLYRDSTLTLLDVVRKDEIARPARGDEEAIARHGERAPLLDSTQDQ